MAEITDFCLLNTSFMAALYLATSGDTFPYTWLWMLPSAGDREIDSLVEPLYALDSPSRTNSHTVLAEHRSFFEQRFGPPKCQQYVFPFGHPVPLDPSRHITDLKWGWEPTPAQKRCKVSLARPSTYLCDWLGGAGRR